MQSRKPRSNSQVPKLQDFRVIFINAIVKELAKSFPEDQYTDFKIFDPSNWPKKTYAARTYGLNSLVTINERLGNPQENDDISQEWSELLPQMIRKDTFCEIAKSDIRFFWATALGHPKNPIVDWSTFPKIKKLLKKVLCIATGSAECERSFSIMNHIRNKRRSRLAPDLLDALMKIRLNGVDELDSWPANEYANLWVKEHLRADDQTGVSKQKTPNLGHYQDLIKEDEGEESQVLLQERKIMLSNYVL